MNDFLDRFFKALLFGVITIAGLVMAAVFLVSAAIAVGLFYVIAKVRGKPFVAREYWKTTSTRARQTHTEFSEKFKKPGNFSRKPDITDVEIREIK
ncbi:hypothetical protein TKWG_20640 [Advenella kashmirensis WT001]|uniref:Uncharacterized protein n=1 Tax=Advenella kashmirensis (strain DSM 17095 / LMG 22695 / WT001) TaxID=1036672 RepID=I3UFS4_ADVKW|nr:hypothetical protein [Advenella kashmirensis]AFK63862.1 hypothetical protein TKWG_20640 [Advenella kashmirensis WT001]